MFSNLEPKKSADIVSPVQPLFNPSKLPLILFFLGRLVASMTSVKRVPTSSQTMKATSNAETEFAMGPEPTEMSRPATTSRAGFMEAQGTGVHIVMSAKTALELGAPIRGVLTCSGYPHT